MPLGRLEALPKVSPIQVRRWQNDRLRRRAHAYPRVFSTVAAYALAATFAAPLISMFLVSLNEPGNVAGSREIASPGFPTLASWGVVWNGVCISGRCGGLAVWFMHSLEIAIPAVAISVALGVVTAYALIHDDSAFGRCVFTALLLGLFIPPETVVFPTTILLRKAHLFGTTTGLVCVHVLWGLPLVTLLSRMALLSVPRDIRRAARIDCRTFFGPLLHVFLPIVKPMLAAVAILQFTYVWSDYLFGLAFGDMTAQPVTVAVSSFAGAPYGMQDYHTRMAAAFISIVPTLVVYILGGRALSRGFEFKHQEG